MTTKYRTRGFVFKKEERKESDRVFTVFTEDFGKLEILGKAIRKINSKLKGGIDIFSFCEIEFIQGKNQKTLTDAIFIKKPSIDEKRLEMSMLVSNILNDFIKGQEPDKPTFSLVCEIFDNLENKKIRNHQLAFQYFFWNFVSLQGFHLQVENCAVCKSKLNPSDVYFSAKDGGIVCKKCSKDATKINSDVVKTLRLIFKKDWQTISKLKVENSSQKLLENISQNAAHAFCPS